MSINNSKTDTHIYNIINNPPKEFTEPCECCGVSEFQLGVKHAEERIIKLLEAWSCGLDDCPEWRVNSEKVIEFCNTRNSLIALIKGEK